MPVTSTSWPFSNSATPTVSPTFIAEASSGLIRNSLRTRRGSTPAFLKAPFWAEVRRFSLACPKPSVTAEYSSRSGVRFPTTVQLEASMTVTGTRFPSSSNTWVIPIFFPIKPFKTPLLAAKRGYITACRGASRREEPPEGRVQSGGAVGGERRPVEPCLRAARAVEADERGNGVNGPAEDRSGRQRVHVHLDQPPRGEQRTV